MKKLISLLIVIFVFLFSFKMMLNGHYENGELSIYLPGEYISDEVIEQFEFEYGIKVDINTFESNELMYTKLLTGSVYDIIIPSDYMIERLIKEKMIQPLDKTKLTCFAEIYEGVLGMDFDPNNDYTVPYFWGNGGIVYDTTIVDSKDVEELGWDIFRCEKYKGQLYMYDSIRDIFMIADKQLGYSMNTTNIDEINAAYDWLCEIADTMEPAYAADECIDGLAYGEKALGFMYSGDAAYILSENEDMDFYVPESGTNYFVDGMVILKNAKNVENAYKFMNFITSYDAAYDNSSYIGYASVNKDVLHDIMQEDCDFEGNNAYFPRDMIALDEVFHNDEDTLKIISELWTKVKTR